MCCGGLKIRVCTRKAATSVHLGAFGVPLPIRADSETTNTVAVAVGKRFILESLDGLAHAYSLLALLECHYGIGSQTLYHVWSLRLVLSWYYCQTLRVLQMYFSETLDDFSRLVEAWRHGVCTLERPRRRAE